MSGLVDTVGTPVAGRLLMLVLAVLVGLAVIIGAWDRDAQADAGGGNNPGNVDYVGIDTNTAGNSANSIGQVQSFRSNIPLNSPFDIDVFVDQVSASDGLGGWGYNLLYDLAILRINNTSPMKLTDTTSLSLGEDCAPDSDGDCRRDVVRLQPPNPSGEGVLDRMTVVCLSTGHTHLTLRDEVLDSEVPNIANPVGENLVVLNELEADIYCNMASGMETPTPTPSTVAPTPSPTPTPEGQTPSPPPTPTPEGQTPSPTPVPTFTPSPTPEGQTPGPTPTPTEAGQTPTPTPEGQTPTPTPTPLPTGGAQTKLMGDTDCDGSITTRDNQALLRSVLQQNALSQTEPCPDPGTTVNGSGNLNTWGDWDCDGSVTTRDNQALLRSVLQQNALSQTEPCPDIGTATTI